ANGAPASVEERAKRGAVRAGQMWEVDKEWARPYRRFDRKETGVESSETAKGPSTAEITRRLNKIIFPKIDFRDATVREAIEFVVTKAKTLDPENQGVSIVLKLGDEGQSAPAANIPGANDRGGSGTRITLTLNNVPLLE